MPRVRDNLQYPHRGEKVAKNGNGLSTSPGTAGSTATKAFTLSGRACATLKPNAPAWLWNRITQGQTLSTNSV